MNIGINTPKVRKSKKQKICLRTQKAKAVVLAVF